MKTVNSVGAGGTQFHPQYTLYERRSESCTDAPTSIPTAAPSSSVPTESPTCPLSFVDDSCQYSDEQTCNSRGIVDNLGNCACTQGWSDILTANGKCNSCAEGFIPAPTTSIGNTATDCLYSRATTCNGRGTVNSTGSCTCDAFFFGTYCTSFSSGLTSNGDPSQSAEEDASSSAATILPTVLIVVAGALLITGAIYYFRKTTPHLVGSGNVGPSTPTPTANEDVNPTHFYPAASVSEE